MNVLAPVSVDNSPPSSIYLKEGFRFFMCSVDSRRRRLPLIVNAISTKPLVQITRSFVNGPLIAWSRNENVLFTAQCTLRSSVCAYTLLRRVLIHADCKWPSPTPSTTLPLYEMITCFI